MYQLKMSVPRVPSNEIQELTALHPFLKHYSLRTVATPEEAIAEAKLLFLEQNPHGSEVPLYDGHKAELSPSGKAYAVTLQIFGD